MLIRRETPSDVDAIDDVHRAAFATEEIDGEPPEARLVRQLRHDEGWIPALSLVAVDQSSNVVGHVVCTKGSIGSTTALGLGPLGVLPGHQRGGIGAALMHAELGAADALGYPVVVLLGHVEYYPRFGFVPSRSLGILPPEPTWGEHFQARPLAAWDRATEGVFRYAAPFDEL